MSARLYVFAGAPKCGSTWLFERFRAHPQVTTARIKDPFYFDRHHERGDEWYWALFGVDGSAAPPGVYADLSHDYLYETSFPDRCRATAAARGAAPYVHVIVRNPLQRLLSAVRYQVSFEGRLRPGPLHEAYPKMVAESRYSEHLARLLAAFPAGRVRIDLFDDLVADPARMIGEVCAWLAIAETGDWLDVGLSRARRAPRHPRLAMRARRVGTTLRQAGMLGVLQRAKASAVAERVLFRPVADGTVTADPLADLDTAQVAAVLAEETAALTDLLDRDLDALWRTPA